MKVKAGLIALVVVLATVGFGAASLVVPGASAWSDDSPSAISTGGPPTTATESTATLTITVTTSQSTSITQTIATTVIEPPPPTPVRVVVLPDPDVTPGALNPRVRQATIRKTICKTGWTRTVRPPVNYTHALKVQQMVQYGETGSPAHYEEDHFIPLELGGAPRNPKNLWPEPRTQSKRSDPLETKLKRQVCKGIMKLSKARAAIRKFKNTRG